MDSNPISARINAKSQVMAAMLNGSFNWDVGCSIRDKLDRMTDQEYDEFEKKCEETQTTR